MNKGADKCLECGCSLLEECTCGDDCDQHN